jgi:hypothetical protein
MKITSFFIDNFKEISLNTSTGIQEEGGVYGDETNYSTWTLGQSGDTTDFVDIAKTNILYGELYKITLDTGNQFNPIVPGGTPNINGFMNTDPEDYWFYIVENEFVFNGITYDDARRNKFGKKFNPRTDFITLLEYANSVKERVGWVEVNRTRSSLYYELCFEGKRARVDNFYDLDKFLMTAELFDIENNSNIIYAPYENINPYNGENERYYSVSKFNVSPNVSTQIGYQNPLYRASLEPVDSWFTWITNRQGHFRTYKNIPDNIGGYLDYFPWPRGPQWGQYSGMPKEYLLKLITGNLEVLDADINNGTVVKKTKIPSGIGTKINQVPLLIASKERHLNIGIEQILKGGTNALGDPLPVSEVYPLQIWGDIRPSSLIQIGFISNINSPSIGDCQPLEILKDKFTKEDDTDFFVKIEDPYGFDLYKLDKEYKEVYNKYKFCPPRKKVNNSFKVSPIQIPINKNNTKISTGNLEEYNTNAVRIMKIGAFNPDSKLFLDSSKLSYSGPYENRENIILGQPNIKLKYPDVETEIEYFTENNMTLPVPGIDYEDGIYDTITWISGTPIEKSINNDEPYSSQRINFLDEQNLSLYNEIEMDLGIRNPNDFLVTSREIPYGTYRHILENDETGKKTLKIIQNGSDADTSEFNASITSILQKSNFKPTGKIVGVDSDGLPIYSENTLEQSLIDLKEQLFGIKEVIFRGSDVLNGAVSSMIFSSFINANVFDITESDLFGVAPTTEYMNTGISVNDTIDLNIGEKYGVVNTYKHKIFRYIQGLNPKNISSKDFMSQKELTIGSGEIDFIGTYNLWTPYERVKSKNEEKILEKITHILISKYDVFGNKKETWASTKENPKDIPIKLTSTGHLFLDIKTPTTEDFKYNRVDNLDFKIIGSIVEYDKYYKVPVKIVQSSFLEGNDVPGYNYGVDEWWNSVMTIGCDVRYSPVSDKIPPKPSEQKTVTSAKNTYGGWVFGGLYHRNGAWPKDHKFRAGLIGNNIWTPCDGSVETGAWIKVPDERVVVEYHNFNSSEHSIRSYIHDIWLWYKDQMFILENQSNASENILLSPYTRENILYSDYFGKYQPDVSNSSNWDEYERILDGVRTTLLKRIKDIDEKVLILRLRDNNPDPSRGFKSLHNIGGTWDSPSGGLSEVLKAGSGLNYENLWFSGVSGAKGHFSEMWIVSKAITDDDNKMDNPNNYYVHFYPEPFDHTQGRFKKDEWYKAVFVRAITSPSNPNGELSSASNSWDGPMIGRTAWNKSCRELFEIPQPGKYIANENNKKTLCDLLYVSEQLLKMHRARLVEMKKYVDNKIKFHEESDSNIGKSAFRRSMMYVNGLKELYKHFKS